MKTSRISIFAGILAIIYFLFLCFPLLKGLFSNKRKNYSTTEESEWVEMPLMIEDT